MPEYQPTPKRIKRQVTGRVHTFFAVTLPGLESICAAEISSLPVDTTHINILPGGVEFKGRLTSCYVANLHLRIPNRILMRLTEFKATNFRQLRSRSKQIPWELYLCPTVERIFSVKCVQSRLVHTGAISENLEASIRSRMPQISAAKPASASRKQRIHVRIVKDRVVISLDSSGALLFKRGLKQDVGPAPIRETLAAAILKLAGYDGSQTLLDPMCGSGSFSLEAAMIAGNMPAGAYRQFAFMNWPAFREAHWEHLKQTALRKIRLEQNPKVFASDLDKKRFAALKKIADQFDLSDVIHVAHRDFFKLDPKQITDTPGILVLNPPYGIRLQPENKPKQFYARIHQRLLSDYHDWQVALLVKNHTVSRQYLKKLQRIAINHGGIDLLLIFGVIKP